MTASGIVGRCLNTRLFGTYGAVPPAPVIRVRWVRSHGSRVVLVLGENASGKSLFRRMAAAICQTAKPKIEFMGISMQMRVGGMGGGLAGAMVFGSEDWQATSANSVNAIMGGISTCRGRTTPHAIFWDEPDIGLSDDTVLGVGAEMAAFMGDLPEKTVAAFVVTHSRLLAGALAACRPHVLFVGTDRFASLDEWIASRPVPMAPAELSEKAVELLRRVGKVLKS